MKSKICLFIILVIIILTAAFAYRVHVVNAGYKREKAEEYKVNDLFECNGIDYMVTGYDVIDSQEFSGAKEICIKLKIANNSDEVKDCDLTACVIDYNHNPEYPRMESFYEMNDEKYSLLMNVYPGAKFEVTLPFLILKADTENCGWSDKGKVKCELIFKLFPVRKAVKLNL